MNRFLTSIAAFVLLSQAASAEVVERVIAVVNSEAILESDFKLLRERAGNPILLNRYLVSDISRIAKGDRESALNYLIGEKIVESEIKRLNLSVTSARVEQEIRDIAKRNGMGVDDLYAQIRREGLSRAEYQATMKDNLERQALLEQEIVSKIRITDEDALGEYLRSRPNAKISIDEFTVAHIFFSPKRSGPQEALKRAGEVLKRLADGGNFESLAEQFTEDPNFSAGGLLGTFKSGEFLKEIEGAVASLSPGQTSPVVRSRMGFHIVKLIGKKIATDPGFEREKDRIKARMMDQAVQRQFRIWLQTKRDDAFLRINKS